MFVRRFENCMKNDMNASANLDVRLDIRLEFIREINIRTSVSGKFKRMN